MCNATDASESNTQVSAQPEQQASKRATAPAVVTADAEYFVGVIKSYNDRRGFGFLACDETARRFGRDVYLSKVESVAAVNEGEVPLKEGEYVRFAVVLSVEGFPQAAAAQRLHMLCGTVLNFSQEQGGTITCSAGEVAVRSGSFGCLLLHPGDEVRFCLERSADGALEAKFLKLLQTTRPVNSLLGCFSLEFPRDGQASAVLDGHAFATCICFSGLPADLGQAEISKFFVKLGAKEVTVAHASNSGGFASVFFPEVNDVAQFLSVGYHSFTEDANTTLVHLKPCRAAGGQTLPALPPPSTFPGDAGGILVRWDSVSLATAYKVEIRTEGAESWSPVDAVGRVQPAGAAPLLGLQTTGLAIGGLSSGIPYEARVSYVASCGCCCAPSDPSRSCSTAPSTPGFAACPPCSPAAAAPQQVAPQQVPTPPATPPLQETPMVQFQAPHMQQAAPPAPAPVPAPLPAPTPQPPMVQLQAPPMQQPPLMAPTPIAPPQIFPPPQPELYLAGMGDAISVRWSTVGIPAAGYIVEVCEGSTSIISRFACQAPMDAMGCVDLCVQGLRPGENYTACVRSLSHDGFESAPSPWSCWITLPMMLPPSAPPMVQQVQAASHVTSLQPAPSPYSILFDEIENFNSQDKPEKQYGTVQIKASPEIIVGSDDALFLD